MEARLQILESKEQDSMAIRLESTGKIGLQYDYEAGRYRNELVHAFDYLSDELKKHMIEKFPELAANFPDANYEALSQIFGDGGAAPGLRFMIDELLKNAMDASVMNTEKTSDSEKFNIIVKVKIKKIKTLSGNKFLVKISDNGTGFNHLKSGERKEYSELFPEKNFLIKFICCLCYVLCCLCCCCREPLNKSTKNENYLLGHTGYGLEGVDMLSKQYQGGLFFKNRKKQGAKVEVGFIQQKLPRFQRQ